MEFRLLIFVLAICLNLNWILGSPIKDVEVTGEAPPSGKKDASGDGKFIY